MIKMDHKAVLCRRLLAKMRGHQPMDVVVNVLTSNLYGNAWVSLSQSCFKNGSLFNLSGKTGYPAVV
jgi:hypothetical protein